jgi:hypothetical protein
LVVRFGILGYLVGDLWRVGRGTEDAVWVEARGKTRGVRGGPQNEWFVEVCGSLVARTGVGLERGKSGVHE